MQKSQGIRGGHFISWNSPQVNEIILVKIVKFLSFRFDSWSYLRNIEIWIVCKFNGIISN
jgi:hypothetical protein